jgi:hypothetical protein
LKLTSDLRIARGFAARFHLTRLQLNLDVNGYMASLTISDRPFRIVLVTAGLCGAGAVVGAICSAAAVSLIAAIEGGVGSLTSRELRGLLGIAGAFGAVVGMIGAPALSWALLRRVPLGRAMLFTAIGTVMGAVGGELTRPLNPYARTVPAVLVGAFLGFIGAGVLARLRAPTSPTTISTEPYNDR